MKIYLASLFSRRVELEEYAKLLQEDGHKITSTWVFGGEDGLTRSDIATLDLTDVERADAVVSFTSPYGSATKGGGRHVEFGYGLALNKQMIIVGERENVFHHTPHRVDVYANLNDLRHAIKTV